MPYLEILTTLVGVAILGWAGDLVSGRRALPAMIVVALTGAICGAFLALRVFAVVNYDSWIWPMWSFAGAAVSMLVYFLFRNKR